MIASMKPRSNITAASVTYMMPICLWSTLVIHSLQRYGIQPLMVMNASTPRITTTTIAPANNGMGWSKGIAPQVSLPNILISLPRAGARIGLRDRAGAWRQRLIQNLFEQPLLDRLERDRLRQDALLGKLNIALRGQVFSRPANLTEPVVKFRRRLRYDLEMHVGKPVAAYLSRKAAKGAGLVGCKMELRRHLVHSVDHAAELGHEECGHHAARGQREMDRRPSRNHQTIDAGDVLIGVDEQPFPVERYDLNIER